MSLALLLKGLIAKIEEDTGLRSAVETHAPPAPVDELLSYEPANQQDALDHLGKLQSALAGATDVQEIGKILVAIGGIIEGFFPSYQQEGEFLIEVGTALENGNKTGSVGPLRLGAVGITVSWAPWKSEDTTAPSTTS